MPLKSRVTSILLLCCVCNTLLSDYIFVTNNDGSATTEGSLGAALQFVGDNSVIDCSPIAGQTITLTSSASLAALGRNFTSSTSKLTILGSGVTIDGGNTNQVFSLGLGSATITGFTIQNGRSQGGAGGAGYHGGGGGVGGGGAIYVHSGTTMTISAMNLNNNQAIGGIGGAGNATGGAGGGGGGFSGGSGGRAILTGANAGAGGGGGGNKSGTVGGRDGGVGAPNPFGNGGGAGGGGTDTVLIGAKSGGSNAASNSSTSAAPATMGGAPGIGNVGHVAGAGGGGGASVSMPLSPPYPLIPPNNGSGFTGSAAPPSGNGIGGNGGFGFGADFTYGAGGGGGGNEGGSGFGTSGGGGGVNGSGGTGGSLGGGGGGSVHGNGGNSGFGAGGGAGVIGGTDTYGNLGGAGGSAASDPSGGGGGAGLGGAIFIQEGGLLIVEDGVSFSNNATVAGAGGAAAGLGSPGQAGASLGQDIFIQSGGMLTLQINNTLSIPNSIEGAGTPPGTLLPGLLKSGAGSVYLNGANTYLGDTVIQSGILNVKGSVSGDVYVDSMGTLSGNATVTGNIYNSGTLLPGNSIGTIFTTDLYLYPTSVYSVEVNPIGGSDEIIASGSAFIGGDIVVVSDGVNYTTPLTYTIISSNAGISGQFSSLSSVTPAILQLVYNPLNVQLTYLPLEAVGLTNNTYNTAVCLSSLSPIPGSDAGVVNKALFALSFDQIQDALEQMGPSQYCGPTEVQLLDAILIRSTYTKHLQAFCSDKNARCRNHMSVWIDGVGQWQHQKPQHGQFGYRDTTYGSTVGFDYLIDAVMVGAAVSFTYDNFHLEEFSSKATIHSYYGGFYSRWNPGDFYMGGALLGAQNNYNNTRALQFGTIDRKAHSKHTGNEWLINFDCGYQLCLSRLRCTPYVILDYVLQNEQDYTETGAVSLNLHVHAKQTMLFQGETGILLSRIYQVGKGTFVPTLTLAYVNQTPIANKNYRANFVNSSCVFTGKGFYERNLFAPRLDFSYHSVCDKINVTCYYEGQLGSKYWAQDVGFDLTFRF